MRVREGREGYARVPRGASVGARGVRGGRATGERGERPAAERRRDSLGTHVEVLEETVVNCLGRVELRKGTGEALRMNCSGARPELSSVHLDPCGCAVYV